MIDDVDERFADAVEEFLEHREGFTLVFLLGLLLSIAAQIDPLTQGVERGDVLTPELVDHLQEDGTGKGREAFLADEAFLGGV